MDANSSEGRPVHPPAAQIVIHGATTHDAGIVTSFLQEQDVRPRPREADLVAFLGRSDSALFYALRDGRITGTLGCVRDQSVMHLVYLAVGPTLMVTLAALSAVENYARRQGATLMMAALPRDSKEIDHLRACGYEVDWEEAETIAGRIVTMIDLIKHL